MKTELLLKPTPWPALAGSLAAAITQAQFEQAGVWELRIAEVVLPPGLQQPPKGQFDSLNRWLGAQGVVLRVAASKSRADVLVRLSFSAFDKPLTQGRIRLMD